MTRQAFQVQSITPLRSTIFKVILEAPKGAIPEFFAGQYLELVIPQDDGQSRHCAFSIASAPGSNEIELHLFAGTERAVQIVNFLESNATVEVVLPKGNCHLAPRPQAPLIFIAASSGFAQMKSMIEDCINQQHPYPLHLYWGVREPQDLYLPDLPKEWADKKLVNYNPVVSDVCEVGGWFGRCGMLFEAVVADKANLPDDAHIYICGSPTMVYATLDKLVEAGFKEENVHSDVFDFAPRK